jgi:D-amino-acid dehydrogenase
MKIAVIGAGIIGITTAYELACDGHEVSVFEQKSAAAEGASFGCAGIISTALLLPVSLPPWPDAPSFGPLRRLSHIQSTRKFSFHDHKWLWKWKHSSSEKAFIQSRHDVQSLIAFSQRRLNQISLDLKLDFERSSGQLVLVKTEADLRGVDLLLQNLRDEPILFQVLNQSEARKIEPALSAQAPFHSAIHFPNDEVANCRQFALMLKAEAAKFNVKFHFNAAVTGLSTASRLQLNISNAGLTMGFDRVIFCGGAAPRNLMNTLNISAALGRIRGYSLSASIREPLNAPRGAVMDLQTRIVISRMGNRVRISGGSHLSRDFHHNQESETEKLYQALQHYFPGAVNMSHGIQNWTGSSAHYFDGLPAIGPSAVSGVWLNTGHGSNGWGMAMGTARAVADLMAGRTPEINCEKFDPARLLA